MVCTRRHHVRYGHSGAGCHVHNCCGLVRIRGTAFRVRIATGCNRAFDQRLLAPRLATALRARHASESRGSIGRMSRRVIALAAGAKTRCLLEVLTPPPGADRATSSAIRTPSANPPRTPAPERARRVIGSASFVTRRGSGEPFVAQWATSLLALLGRAEVQVELGADDRTHHNNRDSHEMH